MTLNRRPPVPAHAPVVALRVELSATRLSAGFGQPALDYHRSVSSSCGSRTRLCALKGRDPLPIDERAISARTFHAVDKSAQRAPLTQWVGRCTNPRPLVFSQVLHHLSYRPQRKKPDVVMTSGFGHSSGKVRPDVTSAMDRTGYSPNDRRMYPSLFALRNSGVWKSWLSLG